MPSLRPRISLLAALLLMTIVGMAIVIVQLWREIAPLRTEVRQLRDETGRLFVADPTQVHAIQVRTNEVLVWKWRIWVPDGATVNFLTQWGKVPRTGVPPECGAQRLDPGEQWITMRVLRSAKDDSWFAQIETKNSGFGIPINAQDCWWNWPAAGGMYAEGVQNETAVQSDRDKPFILTRYRTDQTGDSNQLMKNNARLPGFIIWLERK